METTDKLGKTEAKDKSFYPKYTLDLKGQIQTIDTPLVMGILNVTPDSFFDGGQFSNEESIRLQIQKMIDEGADIIDVGASSTRPGAQQIDSQEENRRLEPALKILRSEFPQVTVSVDTFQSEVAVKAVEMGAHIVNDVSGGLMDAKMFETIGDLKVPYVLMHMQGTPQTMQQKPQYQDVFKEVCYFFSQQIPKLERAGVNDIILDPGFGFGKSLEHNYELIHQFEEFKFFGKPILAGVSRKSMINKLLGTTPDQALNGTTVLNTLALLKGASILRVHDVKEAKEAIKIVTFTQNLTS